MKRTTVHLREAQDESVEEIVRESVAREDVPALKRSEALRKLLDAGLEESDLGDLVSEATVVRHREEEFEEKDGWLTNQRTGFETQVQRHFKNRFENGYRPEQLEEWAENMRQRAYHLWPPDVGPDYSERREEALAYVDAHLEAAKEAAEASEFDPLDPEETYSGYSGVEKGRTREGVEFDRLVSDAVDRLAPSERGSYDTNRTRGPDPDAVGRALAKDHGVSEDLAAEAVDRAITDHLDAEEGGA